MIAPSFHPGIGSRNMRAARPLELRAHAALHRAVHRWLRVSDSRVLGCAPELRNAGMGWPWCCSPLLLDGMRLPRAAQLTAARTWSNAPSLDSQTEIELTIENNGSVIIECRLIDDLPPALRDPSAQQEPIRLTAFPRVPASVRYRVEPQERGDCTTGLLYIRYRSPLGLAERWAKAPLAQTVRVYPALRTGEEQQIFLARSRQIDLQLRQTRQRGLGRDFESLRDYREGDDMRDICWTASARRGNLITRQYQTERSQPVWIVLDCGRLMRSRVVAAPGANAALPLARWCSARALQARPRMHGRRRAGAACAVLRRSRRAARLRADASSSVFCPAAARPTCAR